jgi:ssDNA-binding Zn-finger/Zn-ribbon topoisomerase 1
LEKQFVEEGGYSEKLAAARLAARGRKRFDRPDQTDLTDQEQRIPDCPICGNLMVLPTAKSGKSAGKQFWGCSKYPECKGAVKL